MKFKLAFALHNHQPVGNFDSVFEDAHSRCYLPFLELIKKHPRLRFSLHQSGILWDWQKDHHPEFFDLVAEMVSSGQVELLTGAFYEPILSSIPDRDKAGQVAMLTAYLKKHFGVDPKGMWLAERVWEPHLPKTISECGVEYLPLDDTHFKYAGLEDRQLYGTYVTEEAGKTVTLLPIVQRLRYLIPFGEPEKVIAFLAQAARDHPDGLAIYADDGEKFGSWPSTYKHCYLDRWLDRFFSALEDNADWLEVISLGDAVAQTRPLGRVYLPTASYSEMLHWALPADSFVEYEDFEKKLKELKLYDLYGRFVRGGHWRGFLAKYPESNLMHKKMLAVSNLYDDVSRTRGINKAELEKARTHLYAGQCNCPYWHGVFGGLYLSHLRLAIYQNLIEAEKVLRRLAGRTAHIACEDFDCDGDNEIIMGGDNLAVTIAPGRGGQIIELDCLDAATNVADCLTRRREGYHQKLLNLEASRADDQAQSIHDMVLAKEEGLDKLLVNDWYLRRPLTDHFLAEGVTLENFLAGQYREVGDFILEPFEARHTESSQAYTVTMERRGHVWSGDFHCPLRLQKTIIFPKRGHTIRVEYRLSQSALDVLPVVFGVEFDFNLLAPDALDRFALIDGVRPDDSTLATTAETAQAISVAYVDQWQKIGLRIQADQPAKIWRMPIHTVSLSESGFEKVFQGNSTLFIYDRQLRRGDELTLGFDLFVGPLESMSPSAGHNRVTANRL